MNDHLQNTDKVLDLCKSLLADMQISAMNRRWDQFAALEQSFSQAMQSLKQMCEDHPDQLADYENRFRDLSQKLRRVMRLVASHMQAASEDIANLEKDSRRLRQLALLPAAS